LNYLELFMSHLAYILPLAVLALILLYQAFKGDEE